MPPSFRDGQAVKVVLDAKTDYPSACNALETLLLHEALVDTALFHGLLRALRKVAGLFAPCAR